MSMYLTGVWWSGARPRATDTAAGRRRTPRGPGRVRRGTRRGNPNAPVRGAVRSRCVGTTTVG